MKIALQELAHSFCRLIRSPGINIEIRNVQHRFLRAVLPLLKELVQVADKRLVSTMPCDQSRKIMLHVVFPLPARSLIEVWVLINTGSVEFCRIKWLQPLSISI